MPGIDVLAEQGDFAHAGIDQLLRFGNDLGDRAGDFGAARIGHDAEGAELVAAFLHGEEGGDAARLRLGLVRCRQVLELVLDGIVGFQHPLAALDALQGFGKPVIGLRADDEIDGRRAAQDFVALGLRDAAGNADHHLAAFAGLFLLQVTQPPERRVDLLGGLLADMTGIEQDEIGVFHDIGRDIAVLGQRVRHPVGIVDVHLTAVGLHKDLADRRAFEQPFRALRIKRRFPVSCRFHRA